MTLTNQYKKITPCTPHLYTKLNAHRSLQGGVNGNMNQGCDSVVVSRQSHAHREWDGLVWLTYTSNKFQGGAALWFSFCNSLAIRVFVSSDGNSVFVPLAFPDGKTSYRFLGLFDITCAWDQDGNQVQGGKKVTFPGRAGHDGPQYTFHLQRSRSNMLTDQELQDLIKGKQLSTLPLPNHLGQNLKKLNISPHTQKCISAKATDSLNCPVTTDSDVRPCTQCQKSSKPQMNAKKRKCEDAVQHHSTSTLPTPRPTHLQTKLKNRIFSPNTTNMQNYQMSTGINAKWHTQKEKGGKAKRNAKKNLYTEAGFVNWGRIAYRSEGGILVTGIQRSCLVDAFFMLLPKHISVDLDINAVRKSIMPTDPNKNTCFKDVDKYARKYYNISIQRVSGNFSNAIGGVAMALLQKTKGNFLVQLHVTKEKYDKDGEKHCVAYDGVSVRDNFQYAKVKLVEERDRNDPLNAREVFSSLFKGQIAQITNIYEMKSLC
jgi:hypothetical protein